MLTDITEQNWPEPDACGREKAFGRRASSSLHVMGPAPHASSKAEGESSGPSSSIASFEEEATFPHRQVYRPFLNLNFQPTFTTLRPCQLIFTSRQHFTNRQLRTQEETQAKATTNSYLRPRPLRRAHRPLEPIPHVLGFLTTDAKAIPVRQQA